MPTTRDAILDGALQVMQTRGLARATTKAIAEAAGFSEAALYKQFADKTAIYLAVIAERLPRVAVVGNGGADLVGTGELAGNLRRIAAELLAFYRVVLPIAMSVFSDTELQVRHRDLVRAAGTGPDVNVRGVRAYLESEQEAGRVRAGAPVEGAALALVGACMHQAFLWTFDHAEDVDVDAAAGIAASAVLPGLAS
jgi:AcrR family transcriptional regulator